MAGKTKEQSFVCGTCSSNDDGFCDFIGVLVEDDDSPHCSYGKGWHERVYTASDDEKHVYL